MVRFTLRLDAGVGLGVDARPARMRCSKVVERVPRRLLEAHQRGAGDGLEDHLRQAAAEGEAHLPLAEPRSRG